GSGQAGALRLWQTVDERAIAGPMNQAKFSVVILAAGQGTRMRSDTHRLLPPIARLPMLLHLLSTVEVIGPERRVIVVGKGREQLEKALDGHGVEMALYGENTVTD